MSKKPKPLTMDEAAAAVSAAIAATGAPTAPLTPASDWHDPMQAVFENAIRGAKMDQGRPRAEPQVQHVYELVNDHRDLAFKPAELRKLADETKLTRADGTSMSDGRFRAHVIDARKLLRLRKASKTLLG